jgi:ADP-ribose pyrophosphatase
MTDTPEVLGTERVATTTGGIRLALDRHTVSVPGLPGEQAWHTVTAQDGTPGVVCVVVRDGRVLLGRHWRLATGHVELELPRGFGERGESPEESARRELAEETGLEAGQTRIVGRFHADSGLLTNEIVIVELTEVAAAGGEAVDHELRDLEWLSPGELDDLMRRGALTDGISVCALTLWRLSHP